MVREPRLKCEISVQRVCGIKLCAGENSTIEVGGFVQPFDL